MNYLLKLLYQNFLKRKLLSLEQVIDDEKSKTSVKYNEGNKGVKVAISR